MADTLESLRDLARSRGYTDVHEWISDIPHYTAALNDRNGRWIRAVDSRALTDVEARATLATILRALPEVKEGE